MSCSSKEKKQRKLPSLRLHESLNPPAGGPRASAAPRSAHSQWGKQKDVCSEPPGQAEPLINRHVLQAGGRPGNSLLCLNCVVGREARCVHAAQRAAGSRAWRGAPSAGGAQRRGCESALRKVPCKLSGVARPPQAVREGCGCFPRPIFCRTWRLFALLLLGSPRPCDMLTMSPVGGLGSTLPLLHPALLLWFLMPWLRGGCGPEATTDCQGHRPPPGSSKGTDPH